MVCKRVAIIYLHLSENNYDFKPLSMFCEYIASNKMEELIEIIEAGLNELSNTSITNVQSQNAPSKFLFFKNRKNILLIHGKVIFIVRYIITFLLLFVNINFINIIFR